jgi:hypothetical protein
MNHAAIFESQIRIGESIDEERNQESCCKEKGCSEEKEVVWPRPFSGREKQPNGPRQRGLFFCLAGHPL